LLTGPTALSASFYGNSVEVRSQESRCRGGQVVTKWATLFFWEAGDDMEFLSVFLVELLVRWLL
jgi:hypothetical protein